MVWISSLYWKDPEEESPSAREPEEDSETSKELPSKNPSNGLSPLLMDKSCPKKLQEHKLPRTFAIQSSLTEENSQNNRSSYTPGYRIH
mmetsp:Transcript_47998/g.55315  ORF Transcript_47998/g.55315 Transcript_47998/m.55315 type:complete len:89 (+) Transcript_47998:447-713(+)